MAMMRLMAVLICEPAEAQADGKLELELFISAATFLSVICELIFILLAILFV